MYILVCLNCFLISDNWLAELHKWCPALVVLAYYGDQDTRQMYRDDMKTNIKKGDGPDVILTTY